MRLNYEILGNSDPALHAHLFPRYADESDLHRGGPVWLYPRDAREAVSFDAARDAALMREIAAALPRERLG